MYVFYFTANIGISRDGDKRWIIQYKALFCVLDIGQVVTWKLTPGLAFDNVKDTLVALKQRLTTQGKKLKEFYIHKCCSWRNKLQQVFGTKVRVYLDIFHAVKKFQSNTH